MLKIRYDQRDYSLTGWNGDSKQFHLLKERNENERVIILDVPIPSVNLNALKYNPLNQTLIPNENYIPPVHRNLLKEIYDLRNELKEKGVL